MAKKSLVIVESPSKAKTIGKFLGSKYKVVASIGHIRDLPKSKLGIDIENNFEPQYISIRGKGEKIKELKKEAKAAENVFLATDPDREGEAISWHIANILGIDENKACRIEFNEITKATVTKAVKNPRPIDLNLVDAQQARRILDRLVGYKISPLLWRKVRPGLSAGRVQSAALKIISDREKLIRDFVPEEYWLISVLFENEEKPFSARLMEYDGNKITIENKEKADQILDDLKKDKFTISKIEEKQRRKKPLPPFTTSTLQQDASNKLGFYTKRTMMVAQQLYEGIEIKGKGTIGLITYIRTDSVRISNDARVEANEYIKEKFGKEYLGNIVFQNRKKDVQDAHEAIRPSIISIEPDEIKDSLSRDQYNLYKLIWNRFTASMMSEAVYDTVQVDIKNGRYNFRANGSRLKFNGYLRVYNDETEEDDKTLPLLKVDDELKTKKILSEQNFTKPPLRFTEASLIKELEDRNIGRPSTYSPIIATLTDRHYVKREKKSLVITDLGFVVTDLMEQYFKEIVDSGFTAGMEDKLDSVELNKMEWKDLVSDFYDTLKVDLEVADKEMEKIKIEDEKTDEVCEKCGKVMVIKRSRYGEFMACSGYPECKNTKSIFAKTGVSCPKCGKDIVARRGKSGRLFYGCSGYPDCKEAYWNKPIDEKCPKCGSVLTVRQTKKEQIVCSNKECGYKK